MIGSWYPVGWRYVHQKIFDANRPDITPPLGVMLLLPFSMLWLTTTLVAALFGDRETYWEILMAFVGGIAPIGVGYGVTTNRVWTRPLAVLSLAVYFPLLRFQHGFPGIWYAIDDPFMAAAGAFLLLLVCYFYLSRSARAYYLLIAGGELPDSLREVNLEPPTWLLGASRILASIVEWAIVLLALAILFGGLLLISHI
jgi:hypothetical protein